MPLPQELTNQLLEYLKTQGPYVLASPEDADYFRKAKYKPETLKKEAPLPPAPPPKAAPKPAEAPPKPVEPPPPKKVPVLQKLEPPPTLNFSTVRNVLSVVAPELPLMNEVPSDAIAKKISERWKTKNQSAPISLLVYQEPPEQRALLEQVAKALDIYFGPAKIVQAEGIEKEKQWGAFLSVADLKLVIVCDYTLWQLSGLMQFYKETPAQGVRVLGNVPIFLLPDLSLYLKDSLLKRSLWKALCQKLS